MLLTYHCTTFDVQHWTAQAAEVLYDATRLAKLRGRRFFQVVSPDGEILAVREVNLCAA